MGFYVIKKRKTLQTSQSQLCARDLLWLETVHVPGEQFVRLCNATIGPAPRRNHLIKITSSTSLIKPHALGCFLYELGSSG